MFHWRSVKLEGVRTNSTHKRMNANPSGGSPRPAGSTYFVDQKKGEVNELKQVRWL